MEVFTEEDGIFRSTVQNLFECIPFYMQRRSIFGGFFRSCMSVPESSNDIIVLLYGLCAAYFEQYQKVVFGGTSGSIEKTSASWQSDDLSVRI